MSGATSSSPTAKPFAPETRVPGCLAVGGFTPLSTTDWPGKLAAVVFVQGCPWRCHYCHNPDLQARLVADTTRWHRVLDTLVQRVGLLDGVVFSGGEPTLDAALPHAMRQVRDLGFEVGLHTAGLYPDRLACCLPLVDWVALDVKTAFDDYEAVTAVRGSGEPVRHSLHRVLASAKPHELRTTWHPALLPDGALMRLADELAEAGAHTWMLQGYRPTPDTQAALGAGWQMPPAALVSRLARPGLTVQLRGT
ncbi:anaerobic ribonucleoside-triphosphate reductase activating protein [uncultured Aquabacterium sp.]|uniref:anaerobic ribonucleoside-triphosphate reductase activating protein n=1 Tax=Aquabacterium sp. TaxID=1872578 RepID=UPI0025DBEE31|nr:anaerobic ribonucleoside-triphosphate reductase activating protein [uncultured Aquabacterium sp.]